MQYKSFMEALKGKQKKLDKNHNGELDAQDFKILRKEENELDEALDPSEIASNPRMYSADSAKKAYYHKNASAADKESLAKHLDRHHGNKEWRKPVKEEQEINESTAELDKHISDLSKRINTEHGASHSTYGSGHSTYKNGGGKIHNMKHVSTDASHEAIFKHLQKMGYKKTSGYDPNPHKFDVHHNHDSMTSKTDPVHHPSGISAHVETEHGSRPKVHFTHHGMKEEVEQVDENKDINDPLHPNYGYHSNLPVKRKIQFRLGHDQRGDARVRAGQPRSIHARNKPQLPEEVEQVDENSGPFSSSDYMPGKRIGGANLSSTSKKDTHVKTFTANREKEANEFAKKHSYIVKKHTYPAGHTNLHPHEYQVHKEEFEVLDESEYLQKTLDAYNKGKPAHAHAKIDTRTAAERKAETEKKLAGKAKPIAVPTPSNKPVTSSDIHKQIAKSYANHRPGQYVGDSYELEGEVMNEDSLDEKLSPSMGAGEYVKDFKKSDAPQFAGKSQEKRRTMAIAAYLSAKRKMKEEVDLDEGTYSADVERAFPGGKASGVKTHPVAPVPARKYIKGTPEYKAHKEKMKPRTGHPTNEEVELDESYAKVETKKYSWGTMKTAHHGSSFSVPMHPEHQKAIHGLKDNQEHKFKDETGRHWTAKRMGDDVHLHSANDGPKTKIKHSDLAESHAPVEQIEERNKQNALMRKTMDASRGARFKAQGNYVPDPEPQHKTAQAHNKAIGRAIRKMSNEAVSPITLKVNHALEAPHEEEWESTGICPEHNKKDCHECGKHMKENMQKTYKDFMMMLEYESDKSGSYKHKGTYGYSGKGAAYGQTDYDKENLETKDDKEYEGAKRGPKPGFKRGPKTNLGSSKLHTK